MLPQAPSLEPLAVEARLGRKAIPPFAALRAFEAVGRLGGVRKAAQALSLDHAVVSRHVRTLEEWVGVPLRQRGRAAGLTEIGALYHARISEALLSIADATAELHGQANQSRLIVWSVPGFAAQWLAGQLSDFGAKHPTIEIELRPTDVCPDLLRNEADIDIRFYVDNFALPPDDKALRSLTLDRPPFIAVAAPAVAHRFVGKSAKDLLRGPLLQEEHDAQWRRWFELHGVETPERLEGPRMWHAHLALGAARRGQGIALANAYLVNDDLATGRLVEINPAGASSRGAIIGRYVMLTRHDRWNVKHLARFRQWLLKAIEGHAGLSDPALAYGAPNAP